DSGTADPLASRAAHLEAADLTAFQPVRGNGFTFADIGNPGGTAGQDPNAPGGFGRRADFTGSAFAGSGQGYGTIVVDPATFATAGSVFTIPHACTRIDFPATEHARPAPPAKSQFQRAQ